MNWRYYGVQEPKLQDIPQPPKYPMITATEVLAKQEEFKKHVAVRGNIGDEDQIRDKLVAEMFEKHIFPIVGKVNLFQTVASFQPGR